MQVDVPCLIDLVAAGAHQQLEWENRHSRATTTPRESVSVSEGIISRSLKRELSALALHKRRQRSRAISTKEILILCRQDAFGSSAGRLARLVQT